MSRSFLGILPFLAASLAATACDAPSSRRTDGAGETEYSIVQLQTVTDPDYPGVGARVLIRDAIVTAVDTYDEDGGGHIGNVWIAEPGGGAWSGVQLFNPVVVPSRVRLAPGDIVEVSGTLDEFVLRNDDGTPMDRDGTETELVDASIQKIGETLPPAPTDVRENDLADLRTAEPWEGCLVRVQNLTLTGGYNRYGEAPTAGGIEVANDLYEIPGAGAGTTIRSLTGVVTYFFGFKVMPRGPEDVEL
ncbi:MAG: hypothetical protein GYA57_09890 [Myxococcales bacterium]|nr:hypothetical protein [Myxococcales bacterium]